MREWACKSLCYYQNNLSECSMFIVIELLLKLISAEDFKNSGKFIKTIPLNSKEDCERRRDLVFRCRWSSVISDDIGKRYFIRLNRTHCLASK